MTVVASSAQAGLSLRTAADPRRLPVKSTGEEEPKTAAAVIYGVLRGPWVLYQKNCVRYPEFEVRFTAAWTSIAMGKLVWMYFDLLHQLLRQIHPVAQTIYLGQDNRPTQHSAPLTDAPSAMGFRWFSTEVPVSHQAGTWAPACAVLPRTAAAAPRLCTDPCCAGPIGMQCRPPGTVWSAHRCGRRRPGRPSQPDSSVWAAVAGNRTCELRQQE